MSSTWTRSPPCAAASLRRRSEAAVERVGEASPSGAAGGLRQLPLPEVLLDRLELLRAVHESPARSVKALAERLGRSRPQITNTLRLLKLPPQVQARVAAGVLTPGHARAILAAGSTPAMLKLSDKIVNEELSVRQAEAAASLLSGSGPRVPVAKKPSAGSRQGQLNEIAERLGDRLDTRVTISLGQKKGTVVIDFATIGDLNRILGELGDDGFR